MAKVQVHKKPISWSRWMRAAAAIAVVIGAGGCNLISPDGSSNCGENQVDTYSVSAPFTFPNPETATISGGQAKFTWSREVRGVCSQGSHSDTRVSFKIYTDQNVPDPASIVIQGRVYHAAFIQPYTSDALKKNLISDQGVYSWETEIEPGLKQGNPDGGPATIVNEIAVSFNSSGNIDVDRVTASNFIKNMNIVTHSQEPK